jgi:YkoY family integral membrane protein
LLSIIGLVVTLVVLEGLLSADNALVLAVMTKRLPLSQQKKALFYGMWGAIIFRAVCIFGWAYIADWEYLWAIKTVGALYLAYLSIKHFASKKKDEDGDGINDEFEENKVQAFFGKLGLSPFVTTIISVELMDIAFSVDSILAAFALSQSFYVLIAGGILGILMMRSVAGVFIKLINKVPEMEGTAFVLIFLIAVKMFVTELHEVGNLIDQHWTSYEAPDWLFFIVLIITFGLTFVVHALKNKGSKKNVAA